MIEQYIAAARRTLPPAPALAVEYAKYYKRITAHTTPIGLNPELYITYSSDRKCELITIERTTYLVYDQYLGQSFNRLNRIQYASHGAAMLSQAFASKFLAERLLSLGQVGPATFFALVAQQFQENVKADGDPFELSNSVDAVRHGITASQEIFVMAHEFAHHRWRLDRDNLTEEITQYISEFLNDKGTAADYYKEALDQAPLEFFEEIFADDFGAIVALRVISMAGIPMWQSAAGAVLAFKYLRLFRHLELLAHGLAALSVESDPETFRRRLLTLKDDIWDGASGNIRLFQFREHFIRHRLRIARAQMPSDDVEDEGPRLIEEYDEKTEFPVVLGLVDRMETSLTPEILADLNEKMGAHNNGVAFVDRLTGWSK
jgi:hypothetical protein